MARKAGSRTIMPFPMRVRERAWQAMRTLRGFDIGQLMSVAEIERSNATKFVRALARAGYLRMVCPANGRRGQSASYRLLRDTGPRAPVLRIDGGVYDPNTGTVHQRAEPFFERFVLRPGGRPS